VITFQKFANPLKEEDILTLEEHQTLFGTIEAILPTNFHLLEELHHVISHWQSTKDSIGEIFVKLVHQSLVPNVCLNFSSSPKDSLF
jgi:hypothetical protein